MHKPLLNVSGAGPEKAKLVGITPGQERFAFLYAVIAAAAIASVMIYSSMAGLAGWPRLLMLIGTVIVGWAVLFSFLEVRRLAQTPKNRADEALVDANPYHSRIVVVEPPTGEATPHHEDHPESPGLDQGQLTSQLPDSMPFIDTFFSRGRDKKQKAGR